MIAGAVVVTVTAVASTTANNGRQETDKTISAVNWQPRMERSATDISGPAKTETPGDPMGVGPEGAGVMQVVEADIAVSAASLDYVALVLDYNGANNLFVKVQQQEGGTQFDCIGFYHGNNVSLGWPGQTGGAAFFFIPASDRFSTAHMTVTHDGLGNVTLDLTNLDGGSGSLSYTRGGWTPLDGAATGLGFLTGSAVTADNYQAIYSGNPICDTSFDDFNRADGPLGSDWATIDGSLFITGNAASGSSGALATYVGGCASGIMSAEADISVVGTNTGYCAMVLDSDGEDNLYIKVQQQGGGGTFDHIGFYRAVNVGGWSGMTGGAAFVSIDPAEQFSTARMKVILDAAGNVRLLIYNRDTGGGVLEYQRGGWTIRNGHGAGIGGWGSNIIDNFAMNGADVCDAFNREDGPLGPHWQTDAGTGQIIANAARPTGASRSIFIGGCGGGCAADLNGDGVVNVIDLLLMLTDWGSCF